MRIQLTLQTKLLIAIGLILALIFAVTEALNYEAMQKNETQDLLDQAERVRSLLMAYRNVQQKVFLDYKVALDETTLHFLPAFAIGRISADYPNWDPSGFKFNNVSDHPRRPEHMADKHELAAMDYFRKNPDEKILFRPFINDKGEEYYLYTQPIWIEQQCLKCHANREDAPPTIRDKYDTAWGYKVGDLRGVLSIKVPAATIRDRTQAAFVQHVWIQLTGFLGIFALVMWFVRRHVSRPLRDLRAAMHSVAAGDYHKRLSGFTGEFGDLSDTFNEMTGKVASHQNALRQLNEELEQRVLERTSELGAANDKISALNECLKSENIRMSSELDVSRKLQQMVLPAPAELESVRPLDIAGFMEAASEVGGDYYDVLQHGEIIKFGIGDVTGHGLESGVLMLMVQTAVRTLLLSDVRDSRTFLNTLNRVIYENTRRIHSDKTMTLALLDYHEQNLVLSGQHEEVLVVRKDGAIERIDTVDLGFSIGLEPDISQFIQERIIHLEAGDGVVLYTDGVVEAFNREKVTYGLDRLCEVIAGHWAGDAASVRTAIVEDVRRHAKDCPQADDITLLVIKQR